MAQRENMKTRLKFIALAILMSTSWGVNAQSAGTRLVRFGITHIAPQVESGNMTAPSFANTKTDMGSDRQISGGLTYMYTDNISFDLPLALPFTHKLYGAGALEGAGQLGSVKSLPLTLFGQYRFNVATSVFRPYVGLGLTYTYFYDETGSGALTSITNPGGAPTRLSIESKFSLTPQLGFSYVLNDKWMLDASFSKTYLKNRTTFSTGQTIDTTLNPNKFSLGVGMKF
jgi:outer membrane protein